MATAEQAAGRGLRLRSAEGRWVVAAVVLGSGAPFLEGTVVNVALPAMAREFELGVSGVQWVLNSYLLALSALILLGGALGDRLGRRRVFVIGLAGFGLSTLACAVAPSFEVLLVARVAQGVAGALLVPASLALVNSVFAEEDRGSAVGQWAGWSGVSTAVGPFVGGWLVDVGSWRLVFVIVLPVVVAAIVIGLRFLPESRGAGEGRLDIPGTVLVTGGLAGSVYALVEGPRVGLDASVGTAGVLGVLLLVAFIVFERRTAQPLLPLGLFSSRQFSGTNGVTLLLYFALGGALLFLTLQLQSVLGYSALAAGAALMPINVIMLLGSPPAGRLAQRVGPRLPMTVGPLIAAAGFLLLAGVEEGSSYVAGILPGVTVFGIGLAAFVAPLTSAMLAAVPADRVGVGSAVNNAMARLAGLLASALLPLLAGVAGLAELGGDAFSEGYGRAMLICAAACVVGAGVAFATIRHADQTPSTARAPCLDEVPSAHHAAAARHGQAPTS